MHMMHMWVVASAEILCLHQHNNTHTHTQNNADSRRLSCGLSFMLHLYVYACVCVCESVYAGDSLYRYWVNALPTAENEATAMRMLPTASENTVNSVSVNKRTTHTHTHVRIATPTHTHTYIYIHIKRGRTARSFCNVYNSNMEPAGGGSSGRAMHFRRGTPTYRQIHTKIRCNRTHTHTHREKNTYTNVCI